MDELHAVRELFTRPAPPRPQVIASARARLSGRTPPRRRIWLRAAVPAIAVAAAASVAAVVAIQAPRTGTGVDQTGPGASPAARSILLTAARTALYRMLADLPGVQSLGQVNDPAGQPGAAVALTGRFRHGGFGQGGIHNYRFSSCTVRQRLIIDAHTGLPLAEELRYLKLPAGQTWSAPGGLFSYQLFRSAQWTNATPPTPGN